MFDVRTVKWELCNAEVAQKGEKEKSNVSLSFDDGLR